LRRDGALKRIARELGVDRKTVKRWLRVGGLERRAALWTTCAANRAVQGPSINAGHSQAETAWCCSVNSRGIISIVHSVRQFPKRIFRKPMPNLLGSDAHLTPSSSHLMIPN
jgi:hypothetical protein